MLSFLRRHVVGFVALFVALSGSAFALTNGQINDGSKVHIRFGPGATGTHTDRAGCLTGETVVGGGAEVRDLHNHHALTTSRPVYHAGNGSQGWIAAANGGGVQAIAVCASQ